MKISKQAINLSRCAVLTKAVLRTSELIGLTDADLAKTIGTSPSSVSRMHGGERTLPEETKEWELSALLIRLFRGLDAIMAGDNRSLKAWMGSYNNDLEAIPQEHIKTVFGLVETVNYVDAHRARV